MYAVIPMSSLAALMAHHSSALPSSALRPATASSSWRDSKRTSIRFTSAMWLRVFSDGVATTGSERLISPSRAAIFCASETYAFASSRWPVCASSSANYNPATQLATFRNGRGFSTCREDDSAGGLFSTKSDTQKDD